MYSFGMENGWMINLTGTLPEASYTRFDNNSLPAMLPASGGGCQGVILDLVDTKKPRFRGLEVVREILLDLLNLLIGGDGGN